MRLAHALASIALVAAPLVAGPATAEPLHLTPPLYREQIRAVQSARTVGGLTTTPQPVAAAKPAEPRRAVEVVAAVTPAR